MKPCPDCGKPLNRGGSANGVSVRCLVCRVEAELRESPPPARRHTPVQPRARKGTAATLGAAILALLRERGPQSRPEIEIHADALGWAQGSVGVALWELKRAGRIVHQQRASRHRRSSYALEAS